MWSRMDILGVYSCIVVVNNSNLYCENILDYIILD